MSNNLYNEIDQKGVQKDSTKVEIEKFFNKIYIQCYKSIFTIDSKYMDKIEIISPFETVYCNIKADIMVDNKKIKELNTKLKFNQEESYDFYDANFSYIVDFDSYLEWICEYIDDLLFTYSSEYYKDLKEFMKGSKISYKIDIIDIEIDRKIENNILYKWENFIKSAYNENEIEDIIYDMEIIKENYNKKFLDTNRHMYINKEEYDILNKIELATKHRKEILLKIKEYRKVIKEIKSAPINFKNIIMIKSQYEENVFKYNYKLSDVDISLSSQDLSIKNKYTNFIYQEENSGIYFKIKFDEDKMKICKSYDEGTKIIMIKDDNIEIKVILNQK